MKYITTIAFDADDTLWMNEPYFQDIERRFCALLEDYLPHHSVHEELFKSEIENLPLYGYGVKGFVLSMIEAALKITNGKTDPHIISKCLEFGKEMLNKDVELLDGVIETVEALRYKYRIIVVTKGDLLDQQRKLSKSTLANHFHHIEVLSEKHSSDYSSLLKRLDCNPEEFLMIGNSIKSDIIPVLDLGGYAIHIPYHTTWAHEKIDIQIENPNFFTLGSIKEVPNLILKNSSI